MQLKIVNSNAGEYLFTGWTMDTSNLKRRLGVQQRYGRDGGFLTGDKKVSTRTIQLQHEITATNDTDYNTQIQNIHGIFYDDYAPFYLIDTDRNIRAEIELDSIAENWSKGVERRLVSITINLILLESYFENLNATSVVWTNAATGNTKLITNVGAVDAYPFITITPATNNPEFHIINQRTQDKISIGTIAFIAGTTIEIDCINGTVYLDNGITRTEISSAIGDGTGFFYFDLGDNTLEYQSPYSNADLTIEYRPRYAF